MENNSPTIIESYSKDQKNYYIKPPKKKFNINFKNRLFKALPVLALVGVILLSAVVGKVFWDYSTLPNIKDKISSTFNQEASVILDRNGEIIYDYKQDAKKEKIALNDIPTIVQHALIVREQERFYKDPNGVPWYNIGGAIFNCAKNIATRNGEDCRGGSGLFQQIVKNTTGNDEANVTRKYRELLQTVKASSDLTKDDVLEVYFNNITFGRNSTGIQAGSKLFFGTGIDEKGEKAIPAHRACFLAAMPNLPDSYTTAVNNKLAVPEIISKSETKTWTYLKKIIDDCLDKLSTVEIVTNQKPLLTSDQAKAAKAIAFEDYGFLAKGGFSSNNKYPFILEFIEEELTNKFSNYFSDQSNLRNQLLQGGFTIRTTFDLKAQSKMDTIFANSKGRILQGGVNMFGSIVLDTKSSEVIAMIGNLKNDQTNSVTGQFGYFQPGSSTKPYYYASAFSNGFNPGTIMPDIKFTDPYVQKLRTNSIANRNDGPVSIRYALQSSLNTVAEESLYLSQDTQSSYSSSQGPINATNFAKKLGLKYAPGEENCLATVLVAIGSCNVSTISHANAMATILNNGKYNEARPIIEITKKTNIVVSKTDVNTIYKSTQAIDAGVARQVTNVISDYNTRRNGILSNSAPNFEIPGWNGDNSIAAKSGTAQVDVNGINAIGDLSAVGGTPVYTVLAWTGKVNAQKGSTTHGLGDSGSTIVPIWKNFMVGLHEGKTPSGFSKESLLSTKLDSKTGLLANEKSSATKDELLTPNQITNLKQASSRDYKAGDNIFLTRTSLLGSFYKNEYDETVNCYRAIPLFPDRKEFVEQANVLSGYSGLPCIATANNTGSDVITTNVFENSTLQTTNIIVKATPKNPEFTITNITLILKSQAGDLNSTSLTGDLTYSTSAIANGKYNLYLSSTNSGGEKTTKLIKNIEINNSVSSSSASSSSSSSKASASASSSKPITIPVPLPQEQ
jgi:membrane peptidoglycan carboxypeptidase